MPDPDEVTVPSEWELLDDRLLNGCRVWDLRARRYRHPKESDDNEFYYIDSRDWVIVIARTINGELILIRQFRCGSNALSWELPGGIIDAGEDPIAAGLRELCEETGYTAKRGEYIGHCRPNPAILNNQCHFVFADEVEPDAAGTDWDEHEEIEVRVLPEKEVFEWARNQTIEHALALTGLLYYRLFKEDGKLRGAEPQLGHSVPVNAGHSTPLNAAELGLSAPRWYSRGYLPHCDDVTRLQSITYRLADSLSQSVLQTLEVELGSLPETEQASQRRRKVEAYLDAGMGCCALRHPAVAQVVEETLLKFDGEKYQLLEWCIMPNHVHVLIEPKIELGKIVQSWKSYTGRWAMKRNVELELGVPGTAFWMREYWDRYIRDERHLRQTVEYIHSNPVKANLCVKPEDWQWCSARRNTEDVK